MMVRSRQYAGGIEVALPIEDLVREAFAVLSQGELDWLQRQYLAQDIRCHFISRITDGKPTEAWRKS